MKKNVFGRQFKRDKNERKALFKGLMSSLVLNDRIQTTEEKAKAIKGQIEKLVTKARTNGVHIPGLLGKYLTPDAIKKLINDVAPRFNGRKGGYTRILKLGNRLSDNARMAMIEWVENDNSKFKVPSFAKASEGKQNSKLGENKTDKEAEGKKEVKKKEEKTKKGDKK